VTAKSEDTKSIQGDPRLWHAYPYFRMHLGEIRACIEGGCSFLRYCRKHCQAVASVEPKPVKAAERRPSGVGSVLGHSKRFPPPLKRPPGLTPEQIERLMDPDLELDPKR